MPKTVNRRTFTGFLLAGAAHAGFADNPFGSRQPGTSNESQISREDVVKRHTVVVNKADLLSPLSVGNGEFAFTADITGLQTFAEDYRAGIPLGTMAQWGFHTAPNPNHYSLQSFPLTYLNTSGREVGYLYYEDKRSPPNLAPAANYLYSNPSRINLGKVGMVLRHPDGRRASLQDLRAIHQELDLWTGTLTSEFEFAGQQVRVVTVCDPDEALIAVSVESALLATDQLAITLDFPYAAPDFSGDGADWTKPEAHRTAVGPIASNRAVFDRHVDDTHYTSVWEWVAGARFEQKGQHSFSLNAASHSISLAFTVGFATSSATPNTRSLEATKGRSTAAWEQFWSSGAALDLSGSRDVRWKELERRVVLSQYLTRIQCAGSLPPQETGLTCNSWCGKFHLEMHWWHGAHFASWGRHTLLERSLPYYKQILAKAQAQATKQGYDGARWPKCVGPSGDPAPTFLECFLIWQQPHPIVYAELCYRSQPSIETLHRYAEIVTETAKFMASFVVWMPERNEYRLGPPISDAAELYFDDHERQWNPTFEVAYWRYALSIAQRWRERLGLKREAKWDHVIKHLPALATRDGLYVAGETATQTFSKAGLNTSHPCFLAPLGMLDGAMVDRETMRRTLRRVMSDWDWASSWGWDYPMIAMTAAKLGESNLAIDALLMETGKNRYLPNGHNFQMPHTLPIYLPGNGGLLYAVAMMAGGWEGSGARHAPGFPSDQTWTVRWEGGVTAP